jgi:ABC-type nitrate/sulfonate/bicarbonate transport system substrate-binding protein
VDALDNGAVDVPAATPYLIQAVLKGSDAAAVIGGPANAVYSLMGKAEIKTAADLKGKVVAMSTPVDTISHSTRLMLAKHGIEPNEYQTKELVGSNARANCLTAGECDAASLGQPEDIVLAQRGYRKLADSLEVLRSCSLTCWRAAVAGGAKGHRDAAGPGLRRRIQIAAQFREPQEIADLIAETTARDRVARQILALYYSLTRRHAQAGRDQHAGYGQGDRIIAETGQISGPLPTVERLSSCDTCGRRAASPARQHHNEGARRCRQDASRSASASSRFLMNSVGRASRMGRGSRCRTHAVDADEPDQIGGDLRLSMMQS